ncbi:MAG: RhuM family protein [Propionivibrio sp.]
MGAKTVVAKFGGQTALAKLLGIQQSAIAYWVKKGAVPNRWQAKLLQLALAMDVELSAFDIAEDDTGTPAAARTVAGADAAPSAIDAVQPAGTDQPEPATADSPFMFYAADSGAIKVQVMLGDETVWSSQRGMGEIFAVDVRTISEHLGNIFGSGELDEVSVIRKFRTTAVDGKNYDTSFYNLDAIISVGYRVNSGKATQFRRWATSVIKEYMVKGFAIDDDRLKQGGALFGKDYFDELLEKIREIRASERRFYQKVTDIFAECSIDYDAHSPIAQQFYAHIQDTLHFAIHGQTSAELVKARADASKPLMGLYSYKNQAKGGKVTKLDVTVGKNYLDRDELSELNRLVSMYLDWAENFARRHKALTMAEWAEKLHGFLAFNAYEVLKDFGRMRRDVADRHALGEYEKFRVVQDREYRSDFDQVVDAMRARKRIAKPGER